MKFSSRTLLSILASASCLSSSTTMAFTTPKVTNMNQHSSINKNINMNTMNNRNNRNMVLQMSSMSIDTSNNNEAPRTFPTSGRKSHPLYDIQGYLKSPEPVAVRNNLSKAATTSPTSSNAICIVSGDKALEVQNQELFFLLNTKEDASTSFDFQTIIAVSPDVRTTKKQLLTREARYTGLLGKLDYETGSLLPPTSVLEQASSWITILDSISDLNMLAQCAGQVENLAILYQQSDIDSTEETTAIQQAFDAILAVNAKASLVIVDKQELERQVVIDPTELETNPPVPLLYYSTTTKPTTTTTTTTTDADTDTEATVVQDPSFLKSESLRLLTECLQLQAAEGKIVYTGLIENTATPSALLAEATALDSADKKDNDDNDNDDDDDVPVADRQPQDVFPKLIKGLREAGYERSQEIDFILRNGTEDFVQAVIDFETDNPQARPGSSAAKEGIVHTEAWWEDPEFQKMVKQSSLRKEELLQANRGEQNKFVDFDNDNDNDNE